MNRKARGTVFVFLVVGILASCASGLLAPDELRQTDFLEKTKVKSGTAYTQALRFFDKNLRYAEGQARSEDSDAGRMKMTASTVCNVFRKPSDLKDYYLTFQLEFESIPGAVALHFTQLRMDDAEGKLVAKPEAQLSGGPQIEAVQPCLKKMVAGLAKAVESTTLTW
jgi:hypothetical protein